MGELFFSQLNCFILQYLEPPFCLMFGFFFANTTKTDVYVPRDNKKLPYLCIKSSILVFINTILICDGFFRFLFIFEVSFKKNFVAFCEKKILYME